MRLLHVVPTYLPATRYGGPIYSVHGLAAAQAAVGHDVSVYTTSVDGAGESPVPLLEPVDLDGVSIRYFPSRWMRRLYWSPEMGDALARSIKSFDLVHTHSAFLWPPLAAARAARRADVPYVVSPRGMLVKRLIEGRGHLRKAMWIRMFERRTIAEAAAVHCTSEEEAQQLRRVNVPLPRNLWIVPNGVNVTPSDRPETARDPHVLLFVGRLSWEKGLEQLLKAMSLVPSVRLLIVGNDETDYGSVLRTQARQLGISERITFRGPVYGEQKRGLYRSAGMLVLPSYSESFGNAALEAMAEGCPVIVTDGVGLADVVRKHRTGVVAAIGAEPLAEAIQSLMRDPAMRAACGAAGRALVEREYTWSVVARAMVVNYQNVLSARSTGGA